MSRTTYLSELLAPVEQLADEPPAPEASARLTALSWMFALVAVAGLIVCALIVHDAVRSPEPVPPPASCADRVPCAG